MHRVSVSDLTPARPKARSAATTRPITLKAMAVGVALIPLNAYWIITTEVVWYSGHPTVVSLFFNAVFQLFALTAGNMALRRIAPRVALHDGELLAIYSMVGIASAIASHDLAQVVVPQVGHAAWYATPENDWARLFTHHLPEWLTISDRDLLAGFYEGGSSFYRLPVIRAWLPSATAWCGFIIVLLLVTLCFNVVIRRRWTEQERLAYPVIQLPLALVSDTPTFFASRAMWIGCAVAFGLEMYNGCNVLLPALPRVPVAAQRVGHLLFTEQPWSALSGIRLSFYPFIIGLGFFIPLDLSFSLWFFYLAWQAQGVIDAALGLGGAPGFPYPAEQKAGGLLALGALALWSSRRHLVDVVAHVAGNRRFSDEDREPVSYRAAVGGLVVGSAALVAFAVAAGMSLWLAIAFFALYAFIPIAVTRLRAELGTPVHDFHHTGPEQLLTMSFGTRAIGARNSTVMSLLWFFVRAHRGAPAPHQLEGLKMAEQTRTSSRHMLVAVVLAVVVGTYAAFWAYLDLAYRYGMADSWVSWFLGHEAHSRLQKWITDPTGPAPIRLLFYALGAGFTFTLAAVRARFVWWPFHPAAYAASGSWTMGQLWSCLFVSWAIKGVALRVGGRPAHAVIGRAMMGLILGEATARSIWGLASVATGLPLGTGKW